MTEFTKGFVRQYEIYRVVRVLHQNGVYDVAEQHFEPISIENWMQL